MKEKAVISKLLDEYAQKAIELKELIEKKKGEIRRSQGLGGLVFNAKLNELLNNMECSLFNSDNNQGIFHVVSPEQKIELLKDTEKLNLLKEIICFLDADVIKEEESKINAVLSALRSKRFDLNKSMDKNVSEIDDKIKKGLIFSVINADFINDNIRNRYKKVNKEKGIWNSIKTGFSSFSRFVKHEDDPLKLDEGKEKIISHMLDNPSAYADSISDKNRLSKKDLYIIFEEAVDDEEKETYVDACGSVNEFKNICNQLFIRMEDRAGSVKEKLEIKSKNNEQKLNKIGEYNNLKQYIGKKIVTVEELKAYEKELREYLEDYEQEINWAAENDSDVAALRKQMDELKQRIVNEGKTTKSEMEL